MKNFSISIKLKILITLSLALMVGGALWYKGFPYLTREKCWSIGIYTGLLPFSLGPTKGIINPVLEGSDVTDIQAAYVADPFMVREGRDWIMFFEVFNKETLQGDIGMAKSSDGLHWFYQNIVLDEPVHLSYPYVFKWGNDFYMMPECGKTRSIRLYKASHFPTKWTFVKTLLTGEVFEDASIIRYQNRWWIFVETNPHNNDTLRLYFSENLLGPWTEHPMSPVVSHNPHRARPGGRLLIWKKKLFRVTQDDAPSYGLKVWAYEITELTPSQYNETPVSPYPCLQGGTHGWNQVGMHHMDLHRLGMKQWIASVDGYRKVWGIRWFRFKKKS